MIKTVKAEKIRRIFLLGAGHKTSHGTIYVQRVGDMWKLLESISKIHPEFIDLVRRRLEILQSVEIHQPIGRRSLARQLNQTERILRSEVELLERQKLIQIHPAGMYLTREGKKVLNQIYPVILPFYGLNDLEEMLKKELQIEEVYMVPGDSGQSEEVKREMGRIAGYYLKNNILATDRIAITGGTSMAALAEMVEVEHLYPDVMVCPARGGLGERVDTQANTIAAQLAKRLGGSYLLLQVPDQLSKEAYQSLCEEPYVRERVEEIQKSRLVFHGIGDAITMAKRRGASSEILELLKEKKAVSEAFGVYFDAEGEMVYQMPTIGLRWEDLKGKRCIAIAGGTHKAEAIRSLAKTKIFQVLITDEGAARAILHASDSPTS